MLIKLHFRYAKEQYVIICIEKKHESFSYHGIWNLRKKRDERYSSCVWNRINFYKLPFIWNDVFSPTGTERTSIISYLIPPHPAADFFSLCWTAITSSNEKGGILQQACWKDLAFPLVPDSSINRELLTATFHSVWIFFKEKVNVTRISWKILFEGIAESRKRRVPLLFSSFREKNFVICKFGLAFLISPWNVFWIKEVSKCKLTLDKRSNNDLRDKRTLIFRTSLFALSKIWLHFLLKIVRCFFPLQGL